MDRRPAGWRLGPPRLHRTRHGGDPANRLHPRGQYDKAIPVNLLYDPRTNPHGVRCTLYDHAVNIYGRDTVTGFARRFLDNMGVQYGLQALNAGIISTAQFLDLNEKIGGLDLDANFTPGRTVGDRTSLRRAYESGRILNGGGGLATMPIIDYRAYSDASNGDLHMRFHSFSMRERLTQANGRADNQVMLVESKAYGLWSTDSPVLRGALQQMDQWLSNLAADTSQTSQAEKVVWDKPADLVDACFTRKSARRLPRSRPTPGRRRTSSIPHARSRTSSPVRWPTTSPSAS